MARSEELTSCESVISQHSNEAEKGETVVHHEYKTMTWLQAGLVMIAETVSLGILSLPASMATLGFVPGTILIVVLGLAAWYTGHAVWQFKLKYPQIRSYPEAGQIVAGSFGRWVAEIMTLLQLIFIAAAHVLTFSVMMNVLTDHGTCTVVFGIVGAVISFMLTLPRTLRGQSFLSAISCASICTAIIIAMVAIGINKPGIGTAAPVAASSFAAGAGAVSSMIIAYTGHVAYPTIIDEMKDARDFPKALALLACCTTTFYLVAAVVVYTFGGASVPSPAFGAAGPLIRKLCYGVAIPTIFVAGTIAASVCAKRLLTLFWAWRRRPQVAYAPGRAAWLSWAAVLAALWLAAWAIAALVPVFHELLALIGAAFATQFCLAFNVVLWLFMQWRSPEEEEGEGEKRVTFRQRLGFNIRHSYFVSRRKASLTVLNLALLGMSLAISGVGIYASITAIARNGPGGKPFSCANNAP